MRSPFTGLRFARMEFDNFRAGKMIKVAICAIALIPLIYAGLFLLAFLDPYGNLVNVPAAVVNEDNGAEVDGEQRNIGQELCDELIKNNDEREEGQASGYNWKFVDRSTADEGLEDATYYMELIIPDNFSESIASADSETPERAELEVYFNPSTNLIAQTVGTSMVTKIRAELNEKVQEEYFNQIFVKISDAADQLQTAVDGTNELADGIATLEDGSSTLTSGLEAAQDGSAEITSGAQSLSSGASTLADGTASLASGSSELTSGAIELATGTGTLASGATSLALGTSQLSSGASSLADGTGQLSSGASSLAQGTSELASGASSMSQGTGELASGASSLAQGTGELSSGAQTLADGTEALSSGASSLESGIGELSSSLKELDDGIAAAQASSSDLASAITGVAQCLEAYEQTASTDPDAAQKYLEQAQTLAAAVKESNETIGGDLKTYVDDLVAALSAYQTSSTTAAEKQSAMESAKQDMDEAQQATSEPSKTLASDAEKLTSDLNALAQAAQAAKADPSTENITALLEAAVSVVAGKTSGSGPEPLIALNTFNSVLSAYQDKASAYQTAAGEYQTAATEMANAGAEAKEAQGAITGYLKGVQNTSTVASSSTQTVADAVDQLYAAVSGDLTSGAKSLASGATSVNEGAQSLASGAQSANDGAQSLLAGTTAVNAAASLLASGAQSANDGAQSLASGAQTVDSGAESLASGAQSVDDGAQSLASGAQTLDSGAGQLASGAATLTTGAIALDSGADTLSIGAKTLATGSNTLTVSLGDAASGSEQITDGLTSAGEGVETLSDGLVEGQEQMKENVANSDAKSEMMSSPVSANGDNETGVNITEVKNYGTGFAPYFIALGMWVGALMISMIMRCLNNRILMSGASSLSAVLASYIPMACISILQVIILLLFIQFGLQMTVEHPLAFYLFGILVALTFTAIIQFFRASLGTVGLVVIVVLLMLQLCTAAGTFPIESELPIFNALNPYLPMTYVVHGFRMAMAGLSTSYIWTDVIVLLAFLVAFMTCTVLWARHRRRVVMTQLYKPLQLAE